MTFREGRVRVFDPDTRSWTIEIAEPTGTVRAVGYPAVDLPLVWRAAGGGPAGAGPLYRLANPGNGDHFYTAAAAERDAALAQHGYVFGP